MMPPDCGPFDVGIFPAGFHGLEIEGPGDHVVHPDAAAAEVTLQEIAARVRPRLIALPGVWAMT